jgi:hypothetical protein
MAGRGKHRGGAAPSCAGRKCGVFERLATGARNCIRLGCNHHGMDRTRRSNLAPIRLDPCMKESNESVRDGSVTGVCWHTDVKNLRVQRCILNHGPARPGPPRVSESAFPTAHIMMPASLSQLHSEQSSDSARQVVPVQRCADSGLLSPSLEFRPPLHRPGFTDWDYSPGRPTVGILDVHCMCIRIVSDPPAGCPAAALRRR